MDYIQEIINHIDFLHGVMNDMPDFIIMEEMKSLIRRLQADIWQANKDLGLAYKNKERMPLLVKLLKKKIEITLFDSRLFKVENGQFVINNKEGEIYLTEHLRLLKELLSWYELINAFESPDTPQEQGTTLEPQQSTETAQESEIVLPPELDTDKARMVFQNALDAGYMEKQGNGYKWNKSKALLAYMCGRLIFGDEINGELEYKHHDKGKLFPDSAVCKLFNLDTRLSNSRLQMENAPRGYKKIDELFTNQEDSI